MADKLERIYTVPLSKAYDYIRTRRTERAVKLLREFVSRHMKVELENVRISEGINSLLWRDSIQKPPRKVKVRVVRENESARAWLLGEEEEIKKIAEEKKKAAEAKKKEEEKKAAAKAPAKKDGEKGAAAPEAKAENKEAEAKKAEIADEKKAAQKAESRAQAPKAGDTPQPQANAKKDAVKPKTV